MAFQTDSSLIRKHREGTSYADGHCHLIPDWFSLEDVKKIVEKSQKANVKIIVNSALEKGKYEFALETSEFEEIYLSIGVETTKISQERYNQFVEFFLEHEEKIVAIGEIGLDFHWIKETDLRKQQEEFFRKLIDFAQEHDKPIVIHSRGAEQKAIEILKEKGAEDVLMHCFGGSEEQAREISKLSWYVTVPTSTVYRKNFQKILKATSLDSLMFETDSPFHSLEKGVNNDPSSIPTLCKKAAEIIEIDEKMLADITFNNTSTFYRI
jgi:TatD DNase family protein